MMLILFGTCVLPAFMHCAIFDTGKMQLVVYYQWCILIGCATTRLYLTAH